MSQIVLFHFILIFCRVIKNPVWVTKPYTCSQPKSYEVYTTVCHLLPNSLSVPQYWRKQFRRFKLFRNPSRKIFKHISPCPGIANQHCKSNIGLCQITWSAGVPRQVSKPLVLWSQTLLWPIRKGMDELLFKEGFEMLHKTDSVYGCLCWPFWHFWDSSRNCCYRILCANLRPDMFLLGTIIKKYILLISLFVKWFTEYWDFNVKGQELIKINLKHAYWNYQWFLPIIRLIM